MCVQNQENNTTHTLEVRGNSKHFLPLVNGGKKKTQS